MNQTFQYRIDRVELIICILAEEVSHQDNTVLKARNLLDQADRHHRLALAGTAPDPEQTQIVSILPTLIPQVLKDPHDRFIEQFVLILFQPIFDDQCVRAS